MLIYYQINSTFPRKVGAIGRYQHENKGNVRTNAENLDRAI